MEDDEKRRALCDSFPGEGGGRGLKVVSWQITHPAIAHPTAPLPVGGNKTEKIIPNTYAKSINRLAK